MNDNYMFGSKRRWLELAIFLLIVGVGVGSRLWLVDFPNFKPVAALCLFAGFLFSRSVWAIAAGACILMISDWQLGGYQWQLAIAVYGSMAFACGLGLLIKNRIAPNSGVGLSTKQAGSFVLSSLTMSTVFFVVTNFAVWQYGAWYGPGVGGLIDCFAAALPFYRWTLIGDMTFTFALMGCYQVVSMWVAIPNRPQVTTGETGC